jgi:hypothetical protein
VLSGAKRVVKFDSASGRKGWLAKLATSGVDLGDRDTDYIKEYRDAILNGQTVITVWARDPELKDRARQILKAGGASFITFFGPFATEVPDVQ